MLLSSAEQNWVEKDAEAIIALHLRDGFNHNGIIVGLVDATMCVQLVKLDEQETIKARAATLKEQIKCNNPGKQGSRISEKHKKVFSRDAVESMQQILLNGGT